jgi:hypothetical protein
MPQFHQIAIRLSQLAQCNLQQTAIVGIKSAAGNCLARIRNAREILLARRTRVPCTPTHLVAKSIHGNAKKPRLKSSVFDVVANLGRERAESRLRDFFCQFVVSALRAQERKNAGRVRFDNLSPRCGVPLRSSPKPRHHRSGLLIRWLDRIRGMHRILLVRQA